MAKKMLVVYYSWSNGNTEGIAKQLARACGADIERIETIVAYPKDYDATVRQGKREVEEGFKPDIQALTYDPAEYDVVAIGTPTWWYTMAPAVATFLSEHSWEGRTVVPFATSGGWPGSVISDMEEAAVGASFGPALDARFDSSGGARLASPQGDIDEWVEDVKGIL